MLFCRISFILLAFTTAGCGGHLFSRPPGEKFEIGLWVQAEGRNRTLDNLLKIDQLLRLSRTAGVTDLYVQVYRGGKAWYPTRLADDSPSRRAGADPLAYLLGQAKPGRPGKYGRKIRVHAWINAFSLSRNRKAPLITDFGSEAVLRDLYGRSLLDYPADGKPSWAKGFGLGTPGIFLDPAHPGVRTRLASVAAELLKRYPALAGIHLDFIRYPYALPISPGSAFSPRLDFGYGAETVLRFHTETGQTAPSAGVEAAAADYLAWDHWRRLQVTKTVRHIRLAVRGAGPDSILSAAVLPWAERAYLSSFQDWRGWLEEGILDKAVIMNYSRDTTLAAQISRAAAGVRRKGQRKERASIVIGLGAYLHKNSPAGLWRQWRDAREAGADGVALFSYDQMVGEKELWRFPAR